MTPLRENGNELSGAFTEERVFPVSFGQQRLWIIDQIFPGITTYNVPLFLRLTGPLKIRALELSLQTIVHRHETLRTRFAARDGVPAQIVASTCTMPLQTTDLRSSIEENLEQDALLLAQRELNTSFNLSEAPLIRARLVRLTPTNHILLITLHHIISDGSSAELLTRELAQYYAAFSTGQQPSIKSLPMQYSEFSIIQRRLFQSGQLDSQFLYWRKILAGTPTLHTLPCDLSRPEQPSYSGATVTLHLDNDLMDGLSDLARRHRATTFMVLVTAFQVLLSKCSGQTDLVVGTPVSGRTMVEAEPLIGFFVNTIVLRSHVNRNLRFTELLHNARVSLLNAIAHQDIPFDMVVEKLGVPRTLNHNPIFQIMFSTFKAAVQDQHFGDLIATPYIVESTTSRFDLSVNVIEAFNGSWWLQAEYSTELFYRGRIATMLQEYKMILEAIVKDVEQYLSQLYEVSTTHATPKFANDLATHSFGSKGTGSSSATGLQITSQPDAIERRLAKLWGQLLKVKLPIGVDDDFFALGGNSLLAVRLIAEVNRSFGKQIPVSSLFLDKTIRGMSHRLRGNEPGTLSFTAIAKSGSLPPLFAAGCSREYSDLSGAFGTNQPFYQLDVFALQEERLVAGKAMLMTVEQIAEHFIREIRRIQSSGPYFLAGTCEGGVVALEIARQLTRQGHQIGLLMEFDTPVTGYFSKVSKTKHFLWALSKGRFLKSLSQLVRRLFFRWFEETDRELHIWDTIWGAVRAYDPSPSFGGPICVFRASELLWPVDDVAIGWERLGSLTICDVPGDHVRMFCNRTTQRIIQETLLAAQTRHASQRTASKKGATWIRC